VSGVRGETIDRLEAAKRALRDACLPYPGFERCLNELVRAVRADMRRLMRHGNPKAVPVESVPRATSCGHRFFEPDCQGCCGRQPKVASGGSRAG
jgi:hypothetical protein